MIQFIVSKERFLQEYHKRVARNAIENVEWFIQAEDNVLEARIVTGTHIYLYRTHVDMIPESVRMTLTPEGLVQGVIEPSSIISTGEPVNVDKIKLQVNDVGR